MPTDALDPQVVATAAQDVAKAVNAAVAAFEAANSASDAAIKAADMAQSSNAASAAAIARALPSANFGNVTGTISMDWTNFNSRYYLSLSSISSAIILMLKISPVNATGTSTPLFHGTGPASTLVLMSGILPVFAWAIHSADKFAYQEFAILLTVSLTFAFLAASIATLLYDNLAAYSFGIFVGFTILATVYTLFVIGRTLKKVSEDGAEDGARPLAINAWKSSQIEHEPIENSDEATTKQTYQGTLRNAFSNLAIALTTFGIAAFTSAVYERKLTTNTFPPGYTPAGQTGDTIIATLSFVGTFLCLYGQTVCCHQKSTYSNKGSTLLVVFATLSFILGVIVGGLVPIIVNNSAQSNLSWASFAVALTPSMQVLRASWDVRKKAKAITQTKSTRKQGHGSKVLADGKPATSAASSSSRGESIGTKERDVGAQATGTEISAPPPVKNESTPSRPVDQARLLEEGGVGIGS